MNNKIKPTLLILGIASAVTAVAYQTQTFAAAIAAAGGALFGSSVAIQVTETKARKREEAVRVATAFRSAYERNRGLVLPEEICLHGDIDRDSAIGFLDSLAKEQEAEVLPLDRGLAYKFAHPANVLDSLTKNAQAWAEAQTTALKQENEVLKQQLTSVQQQLQLYQTVQKTNMEQIVAKAQAQLTDQPKDPWNNLL